MFDCLADWMSVPLAHYEHAGRETPRTGLSHASIYPYSSVPCADGELVFAVQNPGEWRRLCELVLEKPELIEDPRFRDNPARVANRDALRAIIESRFAKLSRDEAVVRLKEAKLAWGRNSTIPDLSKHPALRRMDVAVPGGAYRGVAPPLRPGLRPRPVPGLGEHGEAIKAEFG